MTPDDALVAKRTLDSIKYMVLSTADDRGRPWATPVYFSAIDYSDFYWVSSPTARHSVNIAVRPEVGIAVFDSTVPIGSAESVYIDATAECVPDDELVEGTRAFSARMPEAGHFTPEDVTGDAPLRLYRARAAVHSILLKGRDPRNADGVDARIKVSL